MVNGYNRFYSTIDETKYVGFEENGRAIRFFNRTTPVIETCYNLVKEEVLDSDKLTIETNNVSVI